MNTAESVLKHAPLVSGVANHEAKSLLVARMASSRQQDYTGRELHSELVDAQGIDPAWKIDVSVPKSYADLSLEPIGAVVKDRYRVESGRLLDSYELTDEGRTRGVAMAGVALRWSIVYPDVSVQQIFGMTQSRTDKRAPEYRMAILNSLLKNPSEGLSYAEIEEQNPSLPGMRTVLESLRIGAARNIYDITSNQRYYDPTLNIGDPRYTGRHPLETLKPERQAIYATLSKLKTNRNIGSITLSGLVDSIIEDNDQFDPKEIRAILVQGISGTRSNLKPLSIAENGRGTLKDKASVVTLKSAYHESLTGLMGDLARFDDPQSQEDYRQSALTIATDIPSSRLTMEKARRFSSRKTAERTGADTTQLILRSIRDGSSLSVSEIARSLDTTTGEIFNENTIRKGVKYLIEAGVITQTNDTDIASGRSQKITRYKTI